MSILNLLDKKKVASKLNYNVVQLDKSSGGEKVIPKGIKSVTNLRDFSSEWEHSLRRDPNVSQLNVKLEAYNRMDQYGAIPAAVLDIFTDEALNVTKSHLPSIEFSISDSVVEDKVRQCLKLNNVLENSRLREDLRTLLKYGDFAYSLRFYRDSASDEDKRQFLKEEIEVKSNCISDPFEPHEISIGFLSPDSYTLEGYRNQIFKLKSFDTVKKDYDPWEFVLFSLPSRRNFPRGNSILEAGRIPFEVLSVSEQLLLYARSSKVERLVVTYPEGSDPSTDFSNLVKVSSNISNSRFMNNIANNGGNGLGVMTRNSDTSLNTMYFIPDTLTLSNIKNNIDVSSIDDVNYLKDKLIDALGVPKSSLQSSLDSGQPSDFRTKPLDEIDSFSANKVPYIQDSFLAGWEKLLTILSFYFGANMDDLKISVMIKSPSKISSKVAKEYTEGFELIRNTIAMYREINPDYEMSFSDLRTLMSNYSLNPDVLNVPGFIKKYSPGLGDEQLSSLQASDDFGGAEDIGTEPSDTTTESLQKSKRTVHNVRKSYLRESAPYKNDYLIEIGEGEFVHPRIFECFVHE